MSTVALYRKFRPTVFEEVKGQDAIVQTLRNQLKTDRIGHAYLFTGTRGTGKTTIAKIFAKAVNCLEPQDGNPCNECEYCKEIAQGNFMDVVEIDAASNTGVDDIRRVIEEIQYTPAKGRYKVYIIDEAHMLSGAAFNAFLKTLEEPPKYVIFILATTEPHKLPITILSRCQRYDFKRIDTDTIAENLRALLQKEGVEAEEKAVVYIAKCADGSMRDAISLLDKCIAFSLGENLTYNGVLTTLGVVDTEVFSHIFRYVTSADAVAALSEFDRVVASGKDISQFVTDFIWYLRNLLLTNVGGGDRDVLGISEENMEILNEDARMVDCEIIMRYIRILSELSNQLRQSLNKQILVEVALIKLAKPQMETDTDSLLDRVRQLEENIWEELNNSRRAVEELTNRAALAREKVAIATLKGDRDIPIINLDEEDEDDDLFAPVGGLEIVTPAQDEDDYIQTIIEGLEPKEETLEEEPAEDVSEDSLILEDMTDGEAAEDTEAEAAEDVEAEAEDIDVEAEAESEEAEADAEDEDIDAEAEDVEIEDVEAEAESKEAEADAEDEDIEAEAEDVEIEDVETAAEPEEAEDTEADYEEAEVKDVEDVYEANLYDEEIIEEGGPQVETAIAGAAFAAAAAEPEGIKTFGNLFGAKTPSHPKPQHATQRNGKGSLYFNIEEPEPVFDNSRAMLDEFLHSPLEEAAPDNDMTSRITQVREEDFDDLSIEEISFEDEAFAKNNGPRPESFAEIVILEWDKIILGCIDPALRVTLNKCKAEVTGPESIVIKATGAVAARFLRGQDTITYVKEIIKEVVGRDIEVTVEQVKQTGSSNGQTVSNDVFAGIDMDIETEED